MAWSQEMRSHLPSTSLVGYFRRRSPWPCSRTEAPLAQCAPRLNGLSKPGSWPVHTPFSTSAMTVQPTEQWVHTVLICWTAPAAAVVWASALVTMPPESVAAAATPPAVRPERRRKVRRSMALPVSPLSAVDRRLPLATPLVLFRNMIPSNPCSSPCRQSGSALEPGQLVSLPDVRCLVVAGAADAGLLRGLDRRRRRRRARHGAHAAQAGELQGLAPPRARGLVLLLPRPTLPVGDGVLQVVATSVRHGEGGPLARHEHPAERAEGDVEPRRLRLFEIFEEHR